MGSTRLPGKSMKFLNKNFRLIDFVIANALKSKYLKEKNIYLLTSNKKNNKILIDHVKKNYKINIITGSDSNVFSRYLYFRNYKKFIFLRLTADNPLVDPFLIDKFIEYFLKSKADYLTTRAMDHSKKWKIKSDYPRGISAEIFNSEKLFYNEKKFNSKIFQSPTWFFFNKLFNAKIKKFKSFGIYKKLGMTNSFTVDNPKDYINVVNFIKKNKCSPGMNNIYNSFL
jgi:spore coat polysaccharide biosynthesis protein SpsF